MNIVIVGQGAIGLLWYSQLYKSFQNKKQQALCSVSLRPSYISKDIPKHISFTDINGKEELLPLTISTEETLQTADVILICVKSYQVKQATLSITPFINNMGSIVLSHNGMGTVDELPAELINNHAVLALLMTHGSLKTEPWKITHTGKGHCDLGVINQQNKKLSNIQPNQVNITVQNNALVKVLNQALPTVTFQENISEKQWIKLAINCVINPITAINKIENGLILSEKFTKLISDILAEVVTIAGYQQVILDQEMLTNTVLQVANITAKNSSSMLCDVLAQRKTEIDYINGYIDKLGKRINQPTPINSALWRQVSLLPHN